MNAQRIIDKALQAKYSLIQQTAKDRTRLLELLVGQLKLDKSKILAINAQDVLKAQGKFSEADLDRMTLTPSRYDTMVQSVEQIVDLPDIIGERYDEKRQSSGIVTSKIRVPIGIILMIYESRPNVTIDAAALAIRTGNAIILKGGHEVATTNQALHQSISEAINQGGFPEAAVTVIVDQARETTAALLKHDEAIDLVIPRGSRKLLEFVRANTAIPTLLHLEGNCHVYIDDQADPDMAVKITLDAKTQRLGTCNTAESLLVHKNITDKVLPVLGEQLNAENIEVRGDKRVCEIIKQALPATPEDWSQEYLGPIISVKIVDSLEDAITHINLYGSGHTDTIITNSGSNAERFLKEVDSSSVMHNTSTRLADGYEYGLGAEIGISTGKLHARGPVGQEGLTTYKWIVESDGVTKGGILNAN